MTLKALVIGGSVGGLSAAHALLSAGVQVLVFEKAKSVSTAGAGLGLDKHAESAFAEFGLSKQFHGATQPMSKEINRAVDARQQCVVVARDDTMNIRSTHWGHIHAILKDALPDGLVRTGHRVVSVAENGKQVVVECERDSDGVSERHSADFVIAADGSMSETRGRFLPAERRRYAGYCAWRGVLKSDENVPVSSAMREAYPDLGDGLYFEMARGHGHAVVYELPGRRLNWLWYVNQPEPELQGSSVTQKADEHAITEMRQAAAEAFPPALAALMRATAAPFLNAIYDKEPLRRFVWGRVALLGEAAHPTTPHGLRSTNMALGDAAALARAFRVHDADVRAALGAYEAERVEPTAREVLFSRWLGQLKQNIWDPDLDWRQLPGHLAGKLLQRNAESYSPQ